MHGPRLWFGMELDFVLGLGFVVFMLVTVIMRGWSILLGLAIAGIGTWVGRVMARYDDRFLMVLWRGSRYQAFYPARRQG